MPGPALDEATIREIPPELARTWQSQGIDPAAFTLDQSGTLAPDTWGGEQDDAQGRTGSALVVDGEAVSGQHLVFGEVIGRGGVGVVRIASQPALARDVAVKLLSDTADSDKSRVRLLREARATGALEHPNIVPVHDIGHDPSGRPMIVMKRIEGTAWTVRLADRPGPRDDGYLEEHLRVLLQVARAVHFAHQRGVIHRDLKPDNVMLGSFGEVYVVDWGIAAALEGCKVPGLPLARQVRDVFGTPAYMAPEMVAADGPRLGIQSDVYLLGALLYRIVEGRPPHKMPNLAATFAKAFAGEVPAFTHDVPDGIRELCERAMARAPEDRFPDAATFSVELEAFLRHRHSLALSEQGKERLHDIEALLLEEDVDAALAARYRECRYAFEHARTIWRGNPHARAGLRKAAELLVAHELSRGQPDAARALLEDLDEPAPLLAAKVNAALLEKERHAKKLERIAADENLSSGDRERTLGAFMLTLGSVGMNLTCAWLHKSGRMPIGHLEYALGQALNLVWGAVIMLWMRKGLLANMANRRITTTSFFSIFGHIVVITTCGLLGVPFERSLVLVTLVFGQVWTIGVLVLDRRMAAIPLTAFVEAALIGAFPAYGLEIIAAGVGFSLVLTGIIWAKTSGRSRPAVLSTRSRGAAST